MGYVVRWRDRNGTVFTRAVVWETRADADEDRQVTQDRPDVASAWVDEVPAGEV